MADKIENLPVINEDAPIDDDNPEWTEEDFAQARPGAEVLPSEVIEAFAKARATRRGRPPQGKGPKVAVKLRLDADVVNQYRAGGPGWQTRINAALRQALNTAD
jgi:uncharacterized protein (DUF4415 family)